MLQSTEVTSPQKLADVIYAAVREDCLVTADANIKALLLSGFTVPQTENPASLEFLCVPEGGEKALEVREGYRKREENETAEDYREG